MEDGTETGVTVVHVGGSVGDTEDKTVGCCWSERSSSRMRESSSSLASPRRDGGDEAPGTTGWTFERLDRVLVVTVGVVVGRRLIRTGLVLVPARPRRARPDGMIAQ